MRRQNLWITLLALLLAPAASHAAPTTFMTALTQANEVPPTGSPATGSATVVLDPAANTLSVHVVFNGLTSNTVMAHIHCCLASPFAAGVNVGVATPVPAFPGFPLGVTSGTYDGVLDLTQAASYNPAFVTAQGGSVAKAEAALIAGIQNGETYLNVHTTKFPGGEIRGFLAAIQTPAPARLSLLTTIPINGTAGNPATKLFSFDISWVDPANGLYYLGDRSNAAVDVIDTTGAFTGMPDTLFGQIGGAGLHFAGDTGTTATSGPNGVTAAFPCIFVTDSPSRVISINAAAGFTKLVSDMNTGGQFRADELAYDAQDGLLIVANNADTPPFGTIFTVNKATCALSNPVKTPFDAAHGVNATNGAEQPVWEPITQRFYVSIPEIGGPGGGGPNGGVARITTAGVVETVYPINFCQPAGLTVGPNGDLLVGCNTVFDLSGKACTAVVPAPNPPGTPASHAATCTGAANPQSAVCNPGRGCAGNALVAVPGVGGGDEVWFNPGDGNYYITAGNDPISPLFGVVGSGTSITGANTVAQLVPTLEPLPAAPGVHGAGTVHSIAASGANNHVYVPLPSNTAYPNCAQGCIAVYGVR